MNAGSSDERLNGRSSKNDHARTTGAQEAGLKNVERGLGVVGKISFDGSSCNSFAKVLCEPRSQFAIGNFGALFRCEAHAYRLVKWVYLR
mgnify:CR=1 FL=1